MSGGLVYATWPAGSVRPGFVPQRHKLAGQLPPLLHPLATELCRIWVRHQLNAFRILKGGVGSNPPGDPIRQMLWGFGLQLYQVC